MKKRRYWVLRSPKFQKMFSRKSASPMVLHSIGIKKKNKRKAMIFRRYWVNESRKSENAFAKKCYPYGHPYYRYKTKKKAEKSDISAILG